LSSCRSTCPSPSSTPMAGGRSSIGSAIRWCADD
jgi:hypothetical protein